MKKLSIVLMLALALTACGKKYNPMDHAGKTTDGFLIASSTSIDAAGPTLAQDTDLSLALKMTKKNKTMEVKALNFESSQELFIGSHIDTYAVMKKMNAAKLEKSFLSWNTAISSQTGNELLTLKETIELNIQNARKDRKLLKLNRAAKTILHLQRQNRINDESGTDLFLAVARRNAGSSLAFSALRPVVIFTKGHMMPGVLTAVSGGWQLHGIEMTVVGNGIIDFGNTKKLDKAIRVIDAEYYIILKSLARTLADPSGAAEQALALTAERYEFPRENWEAKLRPYFGSVANDPLKISFGKSETTSGDKARGSTPATSER